MQVYLGVLICAGFALAASNNSHADAQASVLASEDRLRALISAVPDVLMVYDQHGNPVERLSGITSTDTNVSLTASNQQSFYTIVKQIIATGETQEIEYPVRSGPEETWWWARAVRVYNEQQPHVLWVARDITQQKQLESGLRQKQKMAAIGQLAGGISHDFNNLLIVINGNVQMVLDDEHSSHRHELQEVLDAGERAASLTRQLLDFSRSDVVQPRSIDLNKTVKELKVMLAPGPTSVRIDRTQLEQVILNLVINARDALGGAINGSIIVRTHTVSDRVHLTVQDDGQGMNSDVLERIFEPGQGALFQIVWPCQPPSYDAIGSPEETQQGAAQHVLVVEDEPLVLKLAVRVLRHLGYEVLHATNGAESLQIAASTDTPIDVLLTDVILPNLDGQEVAKRILELQPGDQVVYMSGYTNDIIGEQGVLDRDVIFVQKPFTVQQLAQAMVLALQRANAAPRPNNATTASVGKTE